VNVWLHHQPLGIDALDRGAAAAVAAAGAQEAAAGAGAAAAANLLLGAGAVWDAGVLVAVAASSSALAQTHAFSLRTTSGRRELSCTFPVALPSRDASAFNDLEAPESSSSCGSFRLLFAEGSTPRLR